MIDSQFNSISPESSSTVTKVHRFTGACGCSGWGHGTTFGSADRADLCFHCRPTAGVPDATSNHFLNDCLFHCDDLVEKLDSVTLEIQEGEGAMGAI